VAENDGAGAELGAEGRGVGSGLNRPLTARSNLTFHWLCNGYSPHSYRVLFQSALLLFMHSPCHLFQLGPTFYL